MTCACVYRDHRVPARARARKSTPTQARASTRRPKAGRSWSAGGVGHRGRSRSDQARTARGSRDLGRYFRESVLGRLEPHVANFVVACSMRRCAASRSLPGRYRRLGRGGTAGGAARNDADPHRDRGRAVGANASARARRVRIAIRCAPARGAPGAALARRAVAARARAIPRLRRAMHSRPAVTMSRTEWVARPPIRSRSRGTWRRCWRGPSGCRPRSARSRESDWRSRGPTACRTSPLRPCASSRASPPKGIPTCASSATCSKPGSLLRRRSRDRAGVAGRARRARARRARAALPDARECNVLPGPRSR